jgi:translation initiation factor IF-1
VIGDSRTTEGVVIEALPSALYRVEIGGRYHITAHIGGGVDKNFVRILVGDRVLVELTARDLTRGRIVKRL